MNELRQLQTELVSLQDWVRNERQRILIIFEGRDTAGKGGAIFRFSRYLNPKAMRVVALPKPTEIETGQWYFQRYITKLPNPGEIVFFDRSWYNRAVVEPVMGFCTPAQYEEFMDQVNVVEKLLHDDGIILIKLWFSIEHTEQQRRLQSRGTDPLRRWKLSTVDAEAQKHWDTFTKYKNAMFERCHTTCCPWIIVNGNNKQTARLESIRFVLSQIDYAGKQATGVSLDPAPTIVRPYAPPAEDTN